MLAAIDLLHTPLARNSPNFVFEKQKCKHALYGSVHKHLNFCHTKQPYYLLHPPNCCFFIV